MPPKCNGRDCREYLKPIHFTEKFAQEKGKQLAFFDLKVTSELDNSNGRKYGLGSSGAVTVATVKALNAFYNLQLSQLELFKLATLAHLNVQGNGSCGDIAASCYGGWLAFSTFDHDWVLNKLESERLTTLIESDWPSLKIEPLEVPEEIVVVRKKKEKHLIPTDFLVGGMHADGSALTFTLEAKPSGSLRPDVLVQTMLDAVGHAAGASASEPLHVTSLMRVAQSENAPADVCSYPSRTPVPQVSLKR